MVDLGGRPPKYKSPEEMEKAIDDYFQNCPDRRAVKLRDSEGGEYMDYVPCFTVCGLALHLGFVSRQSMYDYAEKDKFSYIIKKAQTFIEKEYESMLHNPQCTGAIFALKNMGWRDKVETTNENTNVNANIKAEVADVSTMGTEIVSLMKQLREKKESEE